VLLHILNIRRMLSRSRYAAAVIWSLCYVITSLWHYILSFENWKKCKCISAFFFFGNYLYTFLLDTYSYSQYFTSKLLRCKYLKWLHLIMHRTVRNLSRNRAHLLYLHHSTDERGFRFYLALKCRLSRSDMMNPRREDNHLDLM